MFKPTSAQLFLAGGTAIETIKKSVNLWILFDGVENSVFQSQVLNVVHKQLHNKDAGKVTILSFEKNIPAIQAELSKVYLHPDVEFILAQRPLFWGDFSLDRSIETACNQIFKIFPTQIIARGPIAGYIALKALNRVHDERQLLQNAAELPELIIQARGLLAKEYELIRQAASWNPFAFPIRWLRAKQNLAIEKAVYSELNLAKMPFKIRIEAVTPFLADYLAEEFGASPERIKVCAQDDIERLDSKEILANRQKMRHKLGLSESTLIYCYAGSAKPWQCSQETVDMFWNLFENNPAVFFMFLTTEPDRFSYLLQRKNIPASNYLVTTINDTEEYYKHLCAADIGVILRQDHAANWVARPVKVLDYLACGLKIEHNNTVGWVIEVAAKQAELLAQVQAKQVAEQKQQAKPMAQEKVTAAKRAPKITLAKADATVAKTAGKKTAAATVDKKSKAKVKESGSKAAAAKTVVKGGSVKVTKKPVRASKTTATTATTKAKSKSAANL